MSGPAQARPLSLRWRLLAATLVAALAVAVLAGAWLSALFRDEVERQFSASLRTQLDEVTARFELDAAGAPAVDGAALSDPRWQQPYSGLYWQVDAIGTQGLRRSVLRSRSLWDAQLTSPADVPADGQVHVHALRGPDGAPLLALERTVRLGGEGAPRWRLLVAADRRATASAAAAFDRVLIVSLAALVLLLAAAAAAQTAIGLRPLHGLQRGLMAVHAGRAQRLEGRFPRELQPLVDDFNAVLERNAEIVARARSQAGDLAHALKTPLAALAQGAEAARAQPARRDELPALVAEQVALARRQVDWQLSRARAAAALAQPGVRAEVAPVVAGLLRVMQRVHAERGLRIEPASMAAGLAFAGEAQDLQEMLGNLLDNACKWARSVVRVAAERVPDAPGAARLRLIVDDDGPGIEPALRERALARGERLDESMPGSGLGLAIVRERVALYGGTMRLGDAPGGGLRAVIELPALPD
ncbi:MAG: sensor histidine kinase [Rubrivivax sp.]|nr:sensor histidine kinase [Rubrivivax sp.]